MENDNIITKFQALLKNLFQFDSSDLDFGIYRILNYKHDQIEKFIDEDFIEKVDNAFAKYEKEQSANLDNHLDEVKIQIIETLGKGAFTDTGDLNKKFQDTPLGKEFLSVKQQKNNIKITEEIKLQVFNDLYNFFSRYYEEGDFIPQYRYSIKKHKYAIPYNGEEVKLYWANYDQYYTKTGCLFRDYTFKVNDYKIIFRIVSAKEELGSNKATKQRYFLLDDEKPLTIEQSQNILIQFQYRELTADEVKRFKSKDDTNIEKNEKEDDNAISKKVTVKQDILNQNIYEDIINRITDSKLKNYLSTLSNNDKPLLLFQLDRFTAKNTKDYFVHKNLKKFLIEQLDYFIKSDVLSIDTLKEEKNIDKHITRAKVVKEIGEDVIDFLAQIEDFQKRIWEKKKFVIRTEYVITTDRVPEEFYSEIYSNSEQRKEWEELGFDIPDKKEKLKENKLPIDTKHFSSDFKYELLEKLSEKGDIDDLLDGLLIKSENWQALNLLEDKYREKVQTIYIDPPFNKETDADYLYNVKYKDSTWASMLENRLVLARDFLNDKGSIFLRCDYNGNWIVRPIMNDIFGKDNFRNEIFVRRGEYPKGEVNKLRTGTDTIFFYSKSSQNYFITPKIKRSERKWFPMHLQSERTTYNLQVRDFFGRKLLPPKGRHWILNQDKINELIKKGEIRINENKEYIDINGNIIKGEPEMLQADSKIIDSNWTDIQSYTTQWQFQTENSEILLKRVIESTSNEGDLVIDFFLGSGTTTAVAQKLGRKWIGVEMGKHFYKFETKKGPSGVLVRMKEVLASKGNYEPCGISKEVKEYQGGGFFKYQVLEQYEDALDNIELKENKQALQLFKDDYLLKYFLDFETKNSPYLLNISYLKHPFSYKLKVNLEEIGEPQQMVIDISETFNYLLGLKVKKIKTRHYNKAKYLFVLGEKDSKDVVVVWRDYEDDWSKDDFKADKEFIIQELKDWKPQIVYINGQSILTPNFNKNIVEIRYIEAEFKLLMQNS